MSLGQYYAVTKTRQGCNDNQENYRLISLMNIHANQFNINLKNQVQSAHETIL